jgi:uncharacterized protein (DUF1800 family)
MNTQRWQPYRPKDAAPWNLRSAVHLYRRAGFAGTWKEIQRSRQEGPDRSIERMLDGKVSTPYLIGDFEEVSELLGKSAVSSGREEQLKAWWMFRMIFTPDPLSERLTLMWHNHFATSNQKVRNLSYMKSQNELLRKHAKGSFADLLKNVVQSPAMLVWLDAPSNHKDHPNENLARELMELFTLGVGNYSEQDVKEVARALTGWTIKDDKFVFDETIHDSGLKRILGREGAWNGDDVLRILLDQPATSHRIAKRLCEVFMGENCVDEVSIGALASGLGINQLNIAFAIEKILRSEDFFSLDNVGNRPLSPVETIVGCVRALEFVDPAPSTLILSEWCATMGQDLFNPPSVFGWPQGRSWLTARTMIARSNFATTLASGNAHSASRPYKWQKHAERLEMDALGHPISALFTGGHSSAGQQLTTASNAWSEESLQGAITNLLNSPEVHLG